MTGVIEGLPTQRNERWKYTSLRALGARRFADSADTPRLHPSVLDGIPSPRLVFINGGFDAALSDFAALEPGLALSPLSSHAPGTAGAGVDGAEDVFTQLNRQHAKDGALVRVAAGAHVGGPVHLVFVGAPASADIASHSRHVIELGDDSRLALVEHYLCSGQHRHLQNHSMRLSLGEGASLLHARSQDDDSGATLVSRHEARLAARAQYHRLDLELGTALSRNELSVHLLGADAQVMSSGALIAGGRQHVDTRLEIEHVARDTRCNLLWRGLAADRGRIAFHGGITIHAGADGSDARLSNKNLLLSDNAEIDTQPVLQIHADEVKAAHGATVGRLDANALFYLRSRGIALAEARAMLTLAFCREALAAIGDPALVAALSPRLEARLAALEAVA